MEHFGEFVTNHWALFTAFAVITTMLIGNLAEGIGAPANQVSPQRAVQLINRDGAVVVDVRGVAEFSSGHIVGAINVPENTLAQGAKVLEKDRDKPLLLCCAAGMVSARAGRTLKKLGYRKLFALKGGIAAWQQENLPLTRD